MKKSLSALVFALMLATLTGFAQVPPAGNFRFQNVDVPGAPFTLAGGINNLGQIAGFFRDSSGVVHGYVQDNDDIREITFPNARKTFPAAINIAGTVAGSYSDGKTFHGFILEHGAFTSIDFPGAILTTIVDLNDRGDVVGVYEDAAFGLHGFIQDKNGLASIDDPAQTWPTPSTQAFGINDRNTVNGLFLDVNGNSHGFALTHGVFQSIDVPGVVATAPSGLNNSNAMVGFYIGPDNVQHGYLQRGDQFTTLDFPGAVGSTFPFQINDVGTILGIYSDDQGLTHSFIADPVPGANQDGNGTGSIPAINRAPAQSCLPADLVEHPEQIRNPKACKSTN